MQPGGLYDQALAYAKAHHLTQRDLVGYLKQRERAFVFSKYPLSYPQQTTTRTIPSVLTSACNNVDFEDGNFTGWTGAIGFNATSTSPLVITANGINTLGLNSAEPSCSFHTLVSAAAGVDPYSKLPMLDAGGGAYALRIGGENINENGFVCNATDTTFNGYSSGETIQQTFPVTKSNSLFTYKYAAVLDDGGHPQGQQPYFKTEVLDSAGNPVPCLQFYVEADSGSIAPGFINYPGNNGFDTTVSYCNWQTNSLNLSGYIGHNVTVRFTAAGCTLGGHFAYAYVDCSCSTVQLNLNGPTTTCGNVLTVAAPPGAGSYQWVKVPAGPGIIGASNQASCNVNTTGTYQVTITTGSCSYTLDTTLTFLPSPTITTSSTNPACPGVNNGSATITVVTGAGPYTYSWSTNPPQTTSTITGLGAGNYTVQLTQANGCTADTVIKILQPAPLNIPVIPPVTICMTNSEALVNPTIPAGGTPPFTFAWTHSGAPATSPVSPLTSTTYTVTATDANGCVSAPQFFNVNVNPPLTLTTTAPPTLCPGASGILKANPGGGDGTYTYSWTPATGLNSTTVQNPTVTPLAATLYTVIVSDACGTPSDTQTVQVNLYPSLPVVTFSAADSTGCAPFCATFTGASNPTCIIASWNFGDQTPVMNGCGVMKHCYANPGSYPVVFHVTDINGCIDSAKKVSYITVLPVPVAGFTANPNPATIISPSITFTADSGGANTWKWNFGDFQNSTSSLQNTLFTYPDTGCYPVKLLVENSSHCFDSITKEVCIKELFTFYAPDSFTPNGDGLNDTWTPKGNDIDLAHYDLSIFDRWGNQVFTTNVWGKGWDGHANSGAAVAETDLYVWSVSLKDLQGVRHNFIGHLTIFR